MTTTLGSGLQRKPLDAFLRDVHDEVVGTVTREALATILVEFRKMMAEMRVATPAVNVAAPEVSITPSFHVDAAESPEVTVNIQLDRMETTLGMISTQLTTLTKVLSAPVTRTVTRNSQGVIETITEKRNI